jgi:hypothetical protein
VWCPAPPLPRLHRAPAPGTCTWRPCKARWRRARPEQPALSSLAPTHPGLQPCRDLLDRIFDLDEEQRLGIEGVKAHPWYNLPLGDSLQQALDKAAREQAAIDHQVARGLHKVRCGTARPLPHPCHPPAARCSTQLVLVV